MSVCSLSCYQSKTDCSNYNVLRKPHANHKAKPYSRYTKEKEKEIKAYHYGKSSYRQRQQERERGIRELQNSQETMRCNSKSFPM